MQERHGNLSDARAREAQRLPDDRDLAYRPREVAKLLKLGETVIYEKLQSGEIPAFRMGKRWIIPRAALEEWLQQQMEEAN